MADVKAVRAENVREIRARRVAGSFCYAPSEDEPSGMSFICPCGCGNESWLAFSGGASPHPMWNWDGNVEAPTLTPSVLQSGMQCKWHGHLTAGIWRSC